MTVDEWLERYNGVPYSTTLDAIGSMADVGGVN